MMVSHLVGVSGLLLGIARSAAFATTELEAQAYFKKRRSASCYEARKFAKEHDTLAKLDAYKTASDDCHMGDSEARQFAKKYGSDPTRMRAFEFARKDCLCSCLEAMRRVDALGNT